MIDLIDDATGVSWPENTHASTPAAETADTRLRGPVLLASARRSLVARFQVVLSTVGLSLVVSPDGLHALMNAFHDPPELVILDDDLVGVDADRVEEMLGRDTRTAATRIVRLKSLLDAPATGYDDDQDRKKNRLPVARS